MLAYLFTAMLYDDTHTFLVVTVKMVKIGVHLRKLSKN